MFERFDERLLATGEFYRRSSSWTMGIGSLIVGVLGVGMLGYAEPRK